MGEWDMEQLEKAIAEKHGLENKNRPTAIVCRYFLDAVEKKQYGWCVEMGVPFHNREGGWATERLCMGELRLQKARPLCASHVQHMSLHGAQFDYHPQNHHPTEIARRFWQCPNGKECKYRHALPPGYIMKSQMKELLEAEAANVGCGGFLWLFHGNHVLAALVSALLQAKGGGRVVCFCAVLILAGPAHGDQRTHSLLCNPIPASSWAATVGGGDHRGGAC